MIRVALPAHLRTLARVDGEVKVQVEGQVTVRAVLDALEAEYPALRGTIRDQVTRARWRWSPTTPSGAFSSAASARCSDTSQR